MTVKCTKQLQWNMTIIMHISDDSIYRKYWYIVFDIDISYRIVEKNTEFFDISFEYRNCDVW